MTRKRRVWIVNPYGPLPTDGWRSTRTVLLARTLVEHGFEVTWFRNAFDHVSKRTSAAPTETFGFRVRSLPSCAYRKNVSVRRLLSEALFAVRLLRESRREPSAPDVIIAGHATLFAGLASVVLARLHGVPLVIDMFDLWPEAFRLVLPASLRPLARVVFGPLYVVRRLVFRRAAAIIALARVNLEVARAVAPHVPAERCVLVYEGIDDAALPGEAMAATSPAERPASDELRVVYAGTLGHGYDVDGIVAAAAILGEAEGARAHRRRRRRAESRQGREGGGVAQTPTSSTRDACRRPTSGGSIATPTSGSAPTSRDRRSPCPARSTTTSPQVSPS